MAVPGLASKDIKSFRERLWKRQKGICPLCKEPMTPEEATLDHCHKTGHVRSVLHRSCNGAEGRILQWAGPRSRGDDPIFFLRNLIRYWQKDFQHQPMHPTHGKPRRRKRRKKR